MFLCPACTGPPRTNDNPRMLSLASFVFAAAAPAPSPWRRRRRGRRTLEPCFRLSRPANLAGSKPSSPTICGGSAVRPSRSDVDGAAGAGRGLQELRDQAAGHKNRRQGDGDHSVRVRTRHHRRPVRIRQQRPHLWARLPAGRQCGELQPPAICEGVGVCGDGEDNRFEGVDPAGTLTQPTGARAAAAVVLVHGSGPGDRDATIGSNKPFKDWRRASRHGASPSLRYDKRTRVHASKVAALADFTVQQVVIEDVLEAVKALRAEPGNPPARIFVLGHSLGGMPARASGRPIQASRA